MRIGRDIMIVPSLRLVRFRKLGNQRDTFKAGSLNATHHPKDIAIGNRLVTAHKDPNLRVGLGNGFEPRHKPVSLNLCFLKIQPAI